MWPPAFTHPPFFNLAYIACIISYYWKGVVSKISRHYSSHPILILVNNFNEAWLHIVMVTIVLTTFVCHHASFWASIVVIYRCFQFLLYDLSSLWIQHICCCKYCLQSINRAIKRGKIFCELCDGRGVSINIFRFLFSEKSKNIF